MKTVKEMMRWLQAEVSRPDKERGRDARLVGHSLASRNPDGTETWVASVCYADDQDPPEPNEPPEIYSEQHPTKQEAALARQRLFVECQQGWHDPRHGKGAP